MMMNEDNDVAECQLVLSRESGEEDRSATGLLLRTHSVALCLRLATT
jgi:hypothetical protein